MRRLAPADGTCEAVQIDRPRADDGGHMTGQVTALVALAGAVLLLGLLVSLALGRRKRTNSRTVVARKPAPRPQRGALPSAPVRGPVGEPRRPKVRIDVAEPGERGPLFQYGGDGSGFEI